MAQAQQPSSPITRIRGRDMITYNGRRYDFFGKPFNKLVNTERKAGRLVFQPFVINGITYAVNPTVDGKGSREAILELDAATKRGAKQLADVRELWSSFVRQGKEYRVQYDVAFDVVKTLRNGNTELRPQERSYPGAAHERLPKEFTSRNTFKAPRNMSKAELIDYLNEEVVKPQSPSWYSAPENIKVLRLTADPVNGVALGDVPMNTLRNNKESRPGSCVADYILSELHQPDTRLNHITRPMVSHLKTTNQIVDWAKTMGCISVYALDPLFEVFESHIAVEKARVTLMFVVNNNHLYPITDETQKRQIRSANRLCLESVDFTRVNMEDVLYFEDLDYVKPNERAFVTDDEREDRTRKLIHFVQTAGKHCVVPEDSLEKLARGVIEETQMLIEWFHYSGGFMTAFQHPKSGICVMAGRDFQKRRAIVTDYFKKHKVIDFVWKNQGWGEIGRSTLTSCYADIPQSEYSSDIKDIFKNYPIRPYRMCADKTAKEFSSVDIHRCYPAALLHNEDEFNIFGSFDCVRPYVCREDKELCPGEYYICKDFFMGRGTIFVSKGFYPKSFVRYVLSCKYVGVSDITHAIFADRHLRADVFKQWVSDLYDQYPEDSKALINFTIVCFGSLYSRKVKTGVTSDFDTAMATIAGTNNGLLYEITDVNVAESKRLFIIQHNEEKMKDFGDMPIYR